MNKEKVSAAKKALFALDFKVNLKAFIIWAVVLSVFMVALITVYPMMVEMLSSLDPATSSWMDASALQFGDILEYHYMVGTEIFGLGGAIFAAILALNLIGRDFKHGYYENIYTNGLSRTNIVMTRYLQLFLQVFLLNLACTLVMLITIPLCSDTAINFGSFFAFSGMLFVLHMMVATIVYGITIMIPRKIGLGICLGLPLILYVINMLIHYVNIGSDSLGFLEFFTPFSLFTNGTGTNFFHDFSIPTLIVWLVVPISLMLFGVWKNKKIDF